MSDSDQIDFSRAMPNWQPLVEYRPAEVYGYGTLIGTGNAVVGWDPQRKGEAVSQAVAHR